MNTPLRILLTNLDVLSKLKPGDKLYLKKDGTIGSINAKQRPEEIPQDFWGTMQGISISLSQQKQAMYRWWRSESKDTTWSYLQNIIESAIDYSLLDSKKAFCKEILNKLGKVRNGLESLKKTYEMEPNFVSKIETLKLSIDSILS